MITFFSCRLVTTLLSRPPTSFVQCSF